VFGTLWARAGAAAAKTRSGAAIQA